MFCNITLNTFWSWNTIKAASYWANLALFSTILEIAFSTQTLTTLRLSIKSRFASYTFRRIYTLLTEWNWNAAVLTCMIFKKSTIFTDTYLSYFIKLWLTSITSTSVSTYFASIDTNLTRMIRKISSLLTLTYLPNLLKLWFADLASCPICTNLTSFNTKLTSVIS